MYGSLCSARESHSDVKLVLIFSLLGLAVTLLAIEIGLIGTESMVNLLLLF
jgi:hypothetical protein